uniref:NADH-ubiquinone oxidoreductase chain 2 n=1 Tax=Hoplopleura sp. TaxID=2782173 RepID=A0A7S8WWI4_9NEOP|nr:NADH dehydrogenase subunit 2 [Hoplopleura sp.]
MFQMFMMLGILLTLSSSSWLSLWFGMELTVLFFIPFLTANSWFGSVSSVWQFLLYSVFSSMTFLLSGCLLSSTEVFDNISFSHVPILGVAVVLLLKLGLPPAHGWAVCVVGGLPWKGVYVFSTYLKVAPICIMMNLTSFPSPVSPFVFVALALAASASLRAFTVLSLRHILIYSSVLSSGWLAGASLGSDGVAIAYAFMYFLSLFGITSLFSYWGVNSLRELFTLEINQAEKLILLVSMASLAGIPPSPGFFLKVAIISEILFSSSLFTATMLALSTLYVYNYICISTPALLGGKEASWYTPPYSPGHLFPIMGSLGVLFLALLLV